MSGTVTVPELLQAAREGDNRACEQVLEENNGLIWSVVRRYYGRGVEPDDLYQLGCLGFLMRCGALTLLSALSFPPTRCRSYWAR